MGEALVVAVIVLTATEHSGVILGRVVTGGLLIGVLIWAFLLRSRVALRHDGILLRNAFVDTLVPYGLIDKVLVRTVTHVFVGKKKYVGTGVGRTVRAMSRPERPRGRGGRWQWLLERSTPGSGSEPAATRPVTRLASSDLPDFLEQQADLRIKAALPGEGTVRRFWAWPEIGATAVLAVAFLLSMLL